MKLLIVYVHIFCKFSVTQTSDHTDAISKKRTIIFHRSVDGIIYPISVPNNSVDKKNKQGIWDKASNEYTDTEFIFAQLKPEGVEKWIYYKGLTLDDDK